MRSALERRVGKTSLKLIPTENKKNTLEGFPSGQREQTVNLPAPPSMVRIRPPPPYSSPCEKNLIERVGKTSVKLILLKNRKTPGGVPEWPKGADCKSAGSAFDGSNPSPSTILQSQLIELAFLLSDTTISLQE